MKRKKDKHEEKLETRKKDNRNTALNYANKRKVGSEQEMIPK